MINNENELYFKKANCTRVVRNEDCVIDKIENETGDGLMTIYKVFPGVLLIYNDFHMLHCESNFKSDKKLLCVDHCRLGRIEHEVSENAYTYIEKGDLKVDIRVKHSGIVQFPQQHYHGITIAFIMEEAINSLEDEIKNFPVDLHEIQRKYCDNNHPFVIPGEKCIEHIFSELYTVPDKIRIPYFKVKIMELLLYLDALELADNKKDRPYFYKTHVEKVKAIHNFMIENLDKHFTLQELSEKYDISLTTMKKCFKSVYGDSVYSYMRNHRISYAAGF